MSDFAKVLVEHSICHDEGVCNKSCYSLSARYGGGYDCELFGERVDDRVRLPVCVEAEKRHAKEVSDGKQG